MDILLEDSCRVCLIDDRTNKLTSIFIENEGRSISEVINEISGVEIDRNDGLSKLICESCHNRVLDYLNFKQMCIDSDETVRINLILAQDADSETLEESMKASETDQLVEEYYIEDQTSSYIQQETEEIEYDELFAKTEMLESDDIQVKEESDTKPPLDQSTEPIPNEDLVQRMREAHLAKEQQKKHKCPHCDKFFLFPSKVTRHVNAVHKNLDEPKKLIRKNHYCKICEKAFTSGYKVRRHMVVHDTELKIGLQKNWTRNYYLCELCNRKFHTQTTFDRHMLICDLLRKSIVERPVDYDYICVICNQAHASHEDMVEHMKTHAANEFHSCVLCPDVSYSLNEIIRHGKYHEENISYKCCVCSKPYPQGDEFVAHLLRHKSYKPFHCGDCDKTFFDKYKLRQHQNTHDPNVAKNFVCEFCNKAFAACDYLNCHIRRKHSEIKPYQCEFCTKSFAFAHDLTTHESNHTGKKHVCVICNAGFTKAWSLKQHLKLHETNVSELQCSFCDFVAISATKLSEHEATHDESRSPGNNLEESHFNFMEAVSEESDGYNLAEIRDPY